MREPIRNLLALAPAALLLACGEGGTGPAGNGATLTPRPTGRGIPSGPAATATIGPGGGTLASPDGRARLVVPAGALGAATEIGIQPITNEARGSVGPAYRLTPSGQTFRVPVQLAFAAPPEPARGGVPLEAFGVVTQHETGYWLWVGDVRHDAAAGTVTASLTHLSDYSLVQGVQIRPPSASVTPGGSVQLSVLFCTQTQAGGLTSLVFDCAEDPLLTPLAPAPRNWSVNGIVGGNATVGRVSAGGSTTGYSATYTAPASPPNPRTVAVSADAGRYTFGGRTFPRVLLVSNITVERAPMYLVGTSSSVITDATPVYRVRATVRWRLASESEAEYRYVPEEGTVQFEALNSCIQITPPSHALDPQGTNGYLLLRPNTVPPSYTGSAATIWTATYTDRCADPPMSVSGAAGGAWFSGEGAFDPNRPTIAGTFTGGGQTFTYEFRPEAPPAGAGRVPARRAGPQTAPPR